MAGRVYRPTDLLEINWGDLDGVEFRRQEELPVREEIVEDDAGVISSVIVPTLTSVPEDAMESKKGGSEESTSPADN